MLPLAPPASVLVFAVVFAGVSAVPGEAHARRLEAWSVPQRASLTLTGHGYGHGHGMSQYGAEGAARQGLTAQQIVAFYYPGTTPGNIGGRISVHISADTTPDLEVLARRGLAVRDLGTKKKTVLPTGPSRWRLVTTKKGVTKLQSRGTGAWSQRRRLAGAGEFVAPGPIRLVTPSGTAAYRGRLRAVRGDTVNILGLEKYLRGVVPREMPATWSPEAVRAQAIAARTYAAYERAHPRAGHYQVCDTTSCQVYGGVAAEHPAATTAIKATAGQGLLDAAGEPAFTQFSASNGGWSAAGSVAYLTAQADSYDGWSGNPNHTWTRTLTDAAVEAAWPSIGELQGIEVVGRDGNGDWGGRISSLTLIGSARRLTVSGDAARTALGLRSTWFTMAVAARS